MRDGVLPFVATPPDRSNMSPNTSTTPNQTPYGADDDNAVPDTQRSPSKIWLVLSHISFPGNIVPNVSEVMAVFSDRAEAFRYMAELAGPAPDNGGGDLRELFDGNGKSLGSGYERIHDEMYDRIFWVVKRGIEKHGAADRLREEREARELAIVKSWSPVQPET